MKLKLKSDSGLVREVPTGLSFTGLFFILQINQVRQIGAHALHNVGADSSK